MDRQGSIDWTLEVDGREVDVEVSYLFIEGEPASFETPASSSYVEFCGAIDSAGRSVEIGDDTEALEIAIFEAEADHDDSDCYDWEAMRDEWDD